MIAEVGSLVVFALGFFVGYCARVKRSRAYMIEEFSGIKQA